jgi:DNA-binding response OmpR family regulator
VHVGAEHRGVIATAVQGGNAVTSHNDRVMDMLVHSAGGLIISRRRKQPNFCESSMTSSVLVVTTNREVRAAYEQAFVGIGCTVTTAASFEEARRAIATCAPDVLIAALRMGDYNGIHLALVTRIAKPSATAVVVGEFANDSDADARASGCEFLIRPTTSELVGLVTRIRSGASTHRVSQRFRIPPDLRLSVDLANARIVNVSNEGMRVEVPADRCRIDETLRLSVGDRTIQLGVTPKWTRQTVFGTECGLSVTLPQAGGQPEWTQLVNRCRRLIQAGS